MLAEEGAPQPSPPPEPQAVPRLWTRAGAGALDGRGWAKTGHRPVGGEGEASEGEACWSERSCRSAASSTAELDSYLDKYGGDSSDAENRGQGRRTGQRACPPGGARASRQPCRPALATAPQPRERPRGIAMAPEHRPVG
jgi:hypothetical protein